MYVDLCFKIVVVLYIPDFYGINILLIVLLFPETYHSIDQIEVSDLNIYLFKEFSYSNLADPHRWWSYTNFRRFG